MKIYCIIQTLHSKTVSNFRVIKMKSLVLIIVPIDLGKGQTVKKNVDAILVQNYRSF